MKHLLVDLYRDCSYDAPGVKTGFAAGVTSSKHRNKDGKLQNSSFLKLEGAEVYLVLVDLYQDCSYDARGVKTGPAPGVGGGGLSQVRNIGTKKESFKIFLLWN